MDDRSLDDLRIPVAERLAINACAGLTGQRILCGSDGRGQTAAFLAEILPQAQVTCHFLDLFPAEETRDLTGHLPNLSVACTPDLPVGEIDLFVLPVSRGGEAALTREWLQQGYHALVPGGTLLAAVDNPRDTWLHHEIEKLGRNLDRTAKRHGVVYRLKKVKPLKKLRDFSVEFAFRDGERLIRARSEPGVFSYRKLDLGARSLMETMEIPAGGNVLDFGCGSGAVGLAAALRAPEVRVHAVDSNARAIRCALGGAELNSVENFTVAQTADGTLGDSNPPRTGTFDVAVGNPPYFSHYQIAEIFLQAALRGLRAGGRVWIVTKHEEWLVARMQQLFREVMPVNVRGYTVVSGVRG